MRKQWLYPGDNNMYEHFGATLKLGSKFMMIVYNVTEACKSATESVVYRIQL